MYQRFSSNHYGKKNGRFLYNSKQTFKKINITLNVIAKA